MLRDSSGALLAESTTKVFHFKERLDFKFSHSPSWYYLVIKATFDIVWLHANNNTKIEAMRLQEGTVCLDLFDRLPNNKTGHLVRRYTDFAIGLRELAVRPGDIDPSYNCHGYCFGESKYWINDSQVERILQNDSYQELSSTQDMSIVVHSFGRQIVHTAKCHRSNGGFVYVSKAGVRGLEKTERVNQAARGLQCDSTRIYVAAHAEVRHGVP